MRINRILLAAVSVGIACAAYFVFAPGTVWSTDFEGAKASAAKSGKKLLIDFTGSDWCIYCQKLDAEVFSTSEFKSFAKGYVLVCVDLPHQKELPAALKKQNEALAEQFKIDGFPTVIVADASGTEIRRADGYEPGSGPRAYLEQLAPH
jgi:thioredoxin-related protein